MPRKTKKQRQSTKSLEKAREAKRRRVEGSSPAVTTENSASRITLSDHVLGEASSLNDLLTMPGDALDTADEEQDPTFDINSSTIGDIDHRTETFCEEWVTSLDRHNQISLSLFLCFKLTKLLDLGETRAAEVAGIMIGKSDRTVREWRSCYLSKGEIPISRQGKYQRSGVLWTNEHLNNKASEYIRSNADSSGTPNLTVGQFCQWINDVLLPTNAETIDPEFLRNVSTETARKWMKKLGF